MMLSLFKYTWQRGRRDLLLLLTLCSLAACGGDDEVNDVPVPIDPVARPEWVVETPADASVNMTVYVHIPEELTVSAQDLMGAFIGDKCRALGRMTDNDSFVLTIKGTADEHAPVTLVYYNATAQRIFTDTGHISFLADDVIGLEEKYDLVIND